jgi:hypothetical protein
MGLGQRRIPHCMVRIVVGCEGSPKAKLRCKACWLEWSTVMLECVWMILGPGRILQCTFRILPGCQGIKGCTVRMLRGLVRMVLGNVKMHFDEVRTT